MAALGVQFKNAVGEEIPHTPEGMEKLESIDVTNLDKRLLDSEVIIAHDVNNPLLGLEGALMYTPQKGASAEQVEALHKILESFTLIIEKITQKRIGKRPGTGAGGGLAGGLYAFLNASLIPGASFVMDLLQIREKIKDADLVITGEGQIDAQSIHGKATIAVAKLAKEYNIPVLGIAAILGKGYHEVYAEGIDAVFSIINGPMSERLIKAFAAPLLSATANNVARLLTLRIHQP